MKYVIGQANGRQRAIEAVRGAEMGTVIEVGVVSKTREQEERAHAMIGDIARQCRHLNQSWDAEGWKRLCLDLFRKESMADPRLREYWQRHQMTLIPALDGCGVVIYGEQSRNFPAYVYSALIEWLFAYGANKDVKWSDPTIPPVESYDQSRA